MEFKKGDLITVKRNCSGCIIGKTYILHSKYSNSLSAYKIEDTKYTDILCQCTDNWVKVKKEAKKVKAERLKQKLKYKLQTQIITNDKYFLGKGRVGKIITIKKKNGKPYGIMFNMQNNEYNSLNGKCPNKYGYYLSKEEFIKLKEKSLLQLSKEIVISSKKVIAEEIINEKNDIKNIETDIEYNKTKIIELKNQFKKTKKVLEKLEKIKIKNDYKSKFENILKNKKVKRIITDNENIYILTNPLFYADEEIKNIPLGRYLIKFYVKSMVGRPLIASIDYTYKNYIYQHPCISNCIFCLGEVLGETIDNYLDKREIDMVVFSLIESLENPNYNGPYQDILSYLVHMYKVDTKGLQPRQFFNKSFIYNKVKAMIDEKEQEEIYQFRRENNLKKTIEFMKENNLGVFKKLTKKKNGSNINRQSK